jgi:signal transduction histidine kinase
MVTFSYMSLARQFMLVSLAILLVGMLVIGLWISSQIERGVLNRTAAMTSLYMASFVSPRIQILAQQPNLPDDVMQDLDRLVKETALGEQIVSFKIWSKGGRILYAVDRDLVGVHFGVDEDLEVALAGEVATSISDLDQPEHTLERAKWDRLIETYAPVRKEGSDEVLAISEFYQLPSDLESEIRSAQLRSWLVVGLATVIMYLMLAGMVGRGSRTIEAQRQDLESRVDDLHSALRQNEDLRRRVLRAGARATALNERFLRRLSSDLHDGMGQDLTLALMRLEAEADEAPEGSLSASELSPAKPNTEQIRAAVSSAVKELRSVTAGLRLPEVEDLDVVDVVRRAVQDFESKTGQTVLLEAKASYGQWAMPIKITLYRVVQEALANAFRHSNGTNVVVRLLEDGGRLYTSISDDGAGFKPEIVEGTGGLGLAGMRERVELLGGQFSIKAGRGSGTTIAISLPPLEERF